MRKWNVSIAFSASKYVRGIEAETEEEAIEKAIEQEGFATLCHQCSYEIGINDPLPEESCAEEVDA